MCSRSPKLHRARCLAVHSRGAARRGSFKLHFSHEREAFARDGMLYAAQSGRSALRRRAAVYGFGALSHGGGHDVYRCGAVPASTLEEVVLEIAATDVTERGQTRADDRVSEAAMEDRKRKGYFELGNPTIPRSNHPPRMPVTCSPLSLIVRPSYCASLPPGRWIYGKSTLIGRLLYDSKQVLVDQLEHGRVDLEADGLGLPTCRCSRMVCGPSASRASRSTLPTATSPHHNGGSSSPTHPDTSITPATWSPGRRPRTWRSC